MNGYLAPVHTAVVGVLLDRSSQMLPQKEGLVGIVQNVLTKIKNMTLEPPKITMATSLSEPSDLVILADGECTETVQFEVELFEFHRGSSPISSGLDGVTDLVSMTDWSEGEAKILIVVLPRFVGKPRGGPGATQKLAESLVAQNIQLFVVGPENASALLQRFVRLAQGEWLPLAVAPGPDDLQAISDVLASKVAKTLLHPQPPTVIF